MTFLIPQTIETSRLQLRMFTDADWEPLCRMFRDEECVRYTTKHRLRIGKPGAGWQAISGTGTSAGMALRCRGEKIRAHDGARGALVSGRLAEPEIKWSILREFWGNGYATEAASAVKEMSARTLHRSRLISLILPENERSKAVVRSLGGEYEKTIPFRDGQAEVFAYCLTE